MADNAWSFLYICFVLVGVVFGLVVSGLLSAVMLRLAALALGFDTIPFLTAFRCTLMSNFAVLILNLIVSFNYALATMAHGRFADPMATWRYSDAAMQSNPTYYLYALAGGLLVTAAIYCRLIPGKEPGSRISFNDAVALATMTIAIAFAFALVLMLGLYAIGVAALLIPGNQPVPMPHR